MKRYFDQRARTTNSEIGPVTDQDIKNGIVHVLLYKYLEESANCVNVRNNRFTKSIYMNNGYMNLFSFLIQLKLCIFAHFCTVNISVAHPLNHKLLIYIALNICRNKNWIGVHGGLYLKYEKVTCRFINFNTKVVLALVSR